MDLSSVLSYMVDNELEGKESGNQLAKDICEITEYTVARSLRSPIDAMLYAMEIQGCNTLLMPILAPHAISARLKALGKKVIFYDLDAETMTPFFHQDYPIKYTNDMMYITMQFLGGFVEDVDTLPDEFLQLPSIELCWSIVKHSSMSGNLTNKKHNFKIILIEQNTVCTAGGGAVLLVEGKQHATVLKNKVKEAQTWIMLPDFNASLALAQLKQLDEFVARIHTITPLYKSAIQKTRHSVLPSILHKHAVPQCFPIMLSSRVLEVVKRIKKQGIACNFPFQHSTLGVMMETVSNNKDTMLSQYAHAMKYVTNVISVPLYPSLDNEEVGKIVTTISTLL